MEAYERLEAEIAAWSGCNSTADRVVACSSGTAALHLALEALQLPLGSKILVPDFTMVACARAVTLAGLEPVFVDCREDNLLIDPDFVDEACSQEETISAIMPVHIYGRPCDMEAISLLARKYDLVVIEDLAEAHGIPPHLDSYAACYSFYRNKIVAGEEGGAVWFRTPESARRARQLRSLGFTEDHDFIHIPRGHNYRMSNCHAEIVLGSLTDYEENLLKRFEIEERYDYHCPIEWRMPLREIPWVYDVRIPCLTMGQLDRIVFALRREGIQARHGFKPLHTQGEYSGCQRIGGGVAEKMSREILYLPIQPGKTTEGDCRRSLEIIQRVVGDMAAERGG